jgi:putative spermidine/putrescine transport system permease protein
MQANRSAAVQKKVIDWLGIAPFMIFAVMFLIAPTLYLLIGAFLNADGQFTLDNIRGLFTDKILASYLISLKISVASALGGGLVGFFLAWAVVLGDLPKFIRSPIMTFCGVASNFAGVPLAFAFNIYTHGFNLLSFTGLTITYMYFQIPLMVLIITPALDGMKKEWHEAAQSLGATTFQYWTRVALPILFPSILGTLLLMFANAFGAIATAYSLTGSTFNIVPIQLYAQIRGDVLHNPNLGYALAFGMVVITGISNLIYIWLRVRAERWQK